MPLFKVGFKIDCDIMVVASDKEDAFSMIGSAELKDEIDNIIDVDDAHTCTIEIIRKSQVPHCWLTAEPYQSASAEDEFRNVGEIVNDIEIGRQLKLDREYADRQQIELVGV